MKKILIDINHPAHVHLFRHFISQIKKSGYEPIITAKDVPSITTLLKLYQIDFIRTGKKKDGLALKYLYEFFHLIKILGIIFSKKIQYGIGVSMVLPLASKLTPMKSFALDDDDLAVTPISGKFIAYADCILNPSALAYEKRGPQQVCYPSYHELAYLHPDRFTPDPTVMQEIGLNPEDSFFVLRFNAFKAHHDKGVRGLSLEQKLELINLLNRHGRVFITTERIIEPELSAYQLPISADKIHSLLYYAKLFIGDSQTMTTEAALLGTPAVKLNSFAGKLSIPNELEDKYQLCFSFLPENFDSMLATIKELLADSTIKNKWKTRKESMLKDKIDLTSFLVQFISNYPQSLVTQ